MRIVIADKLWIGNARDARDLKLIHDAGIEAVVDLAANEAPAVLSRDITYCRIPLVDGDGNSAELLRLAVNTTAQLAQDGVPTLVACSHGMSRSPTIVAFAVARLQDITAMEATVLTGGSISPAMWQVTELAMRE